MGPEPRVIVQGIPRAQVGERIQEQIAETISQESDPVIEHATLAPVDVYTKPAPVIELMPAPVTKYIAPYPAVSYPSAFSPVDKLDGVVNPQISITADETSQMQDQEIPELHVVEQIQEQIMETISQETV